MPEGNSETVKGVKNVPDTKSKRKFETDWGTSYVPLTVCDRIGATDRIEITVTAVNG